MANANDLFDKGEDVTSLFEGGQAVAKQPDEYSMLGAGALGAAKGATLGFDDEIAGAAAAMTKKIGGDEQSFWNIYREIRDSVRQEHKTAEDQQPTASFLGELAGGFVLPGGVVGKGAVKGASLLQKVGSLAAAGARAGAIGGAGLSEADLTRGEPGQYGKAATDTIGGAALGGLLGGTAQLAGTGAQKLFSGTVNIAKKFPFAADTVEVFQRTKGGQELLGKVNEFSQDNRNLARNIIQDLEDLRKFTGAIKGEAVENIEKSGIKVKVDDLVDNMKKKLDSMTSVEKTERADIDNFKQVLNDIVNDETKQVTVGYMPKRKPAGTSMSPEQLAEQKVTKKTAEAEARDQIKIREMEDQLDRLKGTPATEDIADLQARISDLRSKTEFPPQLATEPVTGMDVSGVSRGMGKAPITEAVMPGKEETFTPIQRIVDDITKRGRTEMTPSEIEKTRKSLKTTAEKAETYVGRELANDTRTQLAKRLDEAIANANDPKIKAELEKMKQAISQVKNVAEAQEGLSLPKYMGQTESPEKTRTLATNRLQRAIQETQKPGSQGKQVISEALDKVDEVMPGMGKTMMKDVEEGSRKEYLARELAKESALSKDPTTLYASGKSVALLGARAAGKAARKVEDTVAQKSKQLVDLGKRVYSATPQSLQNMASAAAAKSPSLSKTIERIAQHNDQAKRRALLFSLMQRADFRELAEGMFSGEEEVK